VGPIGMRSKNKKFGKAKQAQITIFPIKKRQAILVELHSRNVIDREVQAYRSKAAKHRQPIEV